MPEGLAALRLFASGTLAGRFLRQSTGKWEWSDARAVLEVLEKARSWDGTIPEPRQPLRTSEAEQQHIAITDATEPYLSVSKNRGPQPSSLSKYRTSMNQLRTCCDSRG
jgi:hypothetical protein